MLVSAKAAVNNILNLHGPLDGCIRDFPHACDGGWEAVHPDDELVSFGQIEEGEFADVTAASRGCAKIRRERGLALALLIQAAILFPSRITPGHLNAHIEGLSQWAVEGFSLKKRLEDAGGHEEPGSELEQERRQANEREGPRSPAGQGVQLRSARDCAR